VELKEYLISEFVEEYVERHMTRREALRRIAGLVGNMALATGILAACGPQKSPEPSPQATATSTPVPPTATPASPRVAADDPAVEAQAVQFAGTGATILGYLAKPKGNGPYHGVLVCHENRGLLEHIKDVTRRVAKAGYVGLAVDLLSRQGGTDKITDAAQVPGILGNASEDQMVGDFRSGWSYLQTLPYVRKEGPGMVGFCFGGGITWRVATKMPEMKAAVPFYGPNPGNLVDVRNINAAVLGIYGEQDQRIDAGIPAMEEAMKNSGKTFEKIIYPNAGHAFYNDTGQSYREDPTRDAWAKTLAWLDKYLKA